MQVLNRALAELCGHDHLIMMLNNVSEERFRILLAKMSTAYLKVWFSKDVRALAHRLGNDYKEANGVFDTLNTLAIFAKCVGTLLQLEGVEQSVESVQYFVSYKGPGIFQKAVSAILTRDVDAQGKKVKSTVESRVIIHKLVQDVMRTAASSKVQLPQMESIMKGLSVEKPRTSVMKEAWEKLPSLKSGLREGACKPLEDLLLKVVVKKSQDIVVAKTEDKPSISSRDMNILLAVLKEYPREAGIIDLQTNLLKWAKQNNELLAAHEMQSLLEDFIVANKASTGKRGSFTSLDVSQVKEAVQRCNGKIPSVCEQWVHAATYLHLNAAVNHVPLALIEYEYVIMSSCATCFFS